MTKTCTKCHETKPLTDYHLDRKGTHGRRADCGDCARSRDKNRTRPSRAKTVPTIDNPCNYTGCKRAVDITSSGLCGTHHATLSNCRESPLALTGGEWVVINGIRKWAA